MMTWLRRQMGQEGGEMLCSGWWIRSFERPRQARKVNSVIEKRSDGSRASSLPDGQHVHADGADDRSRIYSYHFPNALIIYINVVSQVLIPAREPAPRTSTARLETPETFWHST